ncbi:MAG TPA: NnrS family protein, partial [Pseudolabrys sp.]
GAIGTMTLAIMTRATLGHTGQPLSANWLTQVVYALVLAAAAIRIAAVFSPEWTFGLLHSAAAFWIAAFWGFAIGYGPLLWRRRVKSSG